MSSTEKLGGLAVTEQKTTGIAVAHDMDIADRIQRRIHLVDGKTDCYRNQ